MNSGNLARFGFINIYNILVELKNEFLERMEEKNVLWEESPKSTRVILIFCILKYCDSILIKDLINKSGDIIIYLLLTLLLIESNNINSFLTINEICKNTYETVTKNLLEYLTKNNF